MQEFEIKPHNTYNINEIGFVLGIGQSERVLEVVRHPCEKGKLKFCAQSKFQFIFYLISITKI